MNQAQKVIFNKQIKRARLLDEIRKHPNALIAIEACGSAHHWARTLTEMGYTIRLIPAQHVKALARGNKVVSGQLSHWRYMPALAKDCNLEMHGNYQHG